MFKDHSSPLLSLKELMKPMTMRHLDLYLLFSVLRMKSMQSSWPIQAHMVWEATYTLNQGVNK